MATEQGRSRSGKALRATVGVVLFVVWAVLAFLWVCKARRSRRRPLDTPAL
jgi:hypothetical protein